MAMWWALGWHWDNMANLPPRRGWCWAAPVIVHGRTKIDNAMRQIRFCIYGLENALPFADGDKADMCALCIYSGHFAALAREGY